MDDPGLEPLEPDQTQGVALREVQLIVRQLVDLQDVQFGGVDRIRAMIDFLLPEVGRRTAPPWTAISRGSPRWRRAFAP